MGSGISVFINGVLFGIALAADAFLISLSNGMNAPATGRVRIAAAAAVFALFQFVAPMGGWLCVHTLAGRFSVLEKCLCYIAFAVLCAMGVKAVCDGLRKKPQAEKTCASLSALLAQAALTSVDALSVGFAASALNAAGAALTSLIISAITFAVYCAGFLLGRRFGTRFAGKATVAGGVILIAIGVEALLGGML